MAKLKIKSKHKYDPNWAVKQPNIQINIAQLYFNFFLNKRILNIFSASSISFQILGPEKLILKTP